MNIDELYEDICKINIEYGVLGERWASSFGDDAEELFWYNIEDIVEKYDIKIDINEYKEKYNGDWIYGIYVDVNEVLKLKLMEKMKKRR